MTPAHDSGYRPPPQDGQRRHVYIQLRQQDGSIVSHLYVYHPATSYQVIKAIQAHAAQGRFTLAIASLLIREVEKLQGSHHADPTRPQ